MADTLRRTLICWQALVILYCTFLKPFCLYSAGPNTNLWHKAYWYRGHITDSQCDWPLNVEPLHLQAFQSGRETIKSKKEGCLIAFQHRGKSCSLSAERRTLLLDCSLKGWFTQIAKKQSNLLLVLSCHADVFESQIKLHSHKFYSFGCRCFRGGYLKSPAHKTKIICIIPLGQVEKYVFFLNLGELTLKIDVCFCFHCLAWSLWHVR